MENGKREQIRKIILEQERLTERVHELDGDLDRLLATTPSTVKAHAASPSELGVVMQPTGKGGAKPQKPVVVATAAKPEQTIIEKVLNALRASPGGLEIAELARLMYGSSDGATTNRSTKYLYKLMGRKLVRHEGRKWMLPQL